MENSIEGKKRKSKKSFWERNKENVTVYLFIGPQLILFLLFIVYPVLEGFKMSLFRQTYTEDIFVGLENYKELFADPVFLKSIVNTIVIIDMLFMLISFISYIIAYFHQDHQFQTLDPLTDHNNGAE